MSERVATVESMNRYCVVCRKELRAGLHEHCTDNSVVAFQRKGLFTKRTIYYDLGGELLSELDLAAIRAREILAYELEQERLLEAWQSETGQGAAPGAGEGRVTPTDKDFVEDLGGGVELEMIWVPGGKFIMGSHLSAEDVARLGGGQPDVVMDEHPANAVDVEGFWIGKYQITQEQYRQVVGADPSEFIGPRNPVDSVSWHDAMAFGKKLAAMSGKKFALPTEAQWEYACRAATTTPFPCGETISTDQANFDGSQTYGDGDKGVFRERTVEVGSFEPNGFGLYEMPGNVWEWCLSLYKDYPYHEDDGRNNPSAGGARVLRGGSWAWDPKYCRSPSRGGNDPAYCGANNGLRVVCR